MTPYLTTDEADIYFETRMASEPWDKATDPNKTKAIGHATRLINRLNFKGDKPEGQDNAFPRVGFTAVPEQIKDACCEIAIALIAGSNTELETENLWLRDYRYSGIAEGYANKNAEHTIAGIPSAEAWRLLKVYLRDNNQFEVIRK